MGLQVTNPVSCILSLSLMGQVLPIGTQGPSKAHRGQRETSQSYRHSRHHSSSDPNTLLYSNWVRLVNGNLSPAEGPPARPCLPPVWGSGHLCQHCHLGQGPCGTHSHTSCSKQGMNKKTNARSSLCPCPSPRRRELGPPLPAPEPCFKLKNKPVYIVENFS